jgi:hypothetical protein
VWEKLVQNYALHAREFSDAVAELGHEAQFGPEHSHQLLDGIKARLEACIAIAGEIDCYIKQKAEAAKCR